MLTYIERFQLSNNSTFKQRIQLALWIVCIDVIDENANVPNHAAREALATELLKGEADTDTMRKLTFRLVANDSIGGQGADVTDSALKNAVSSAFNSLL